jgi:hypothetical protein
LAVGSAQAEGIMPVCKYCGSDSVEREAGEVVVPDHVADFLGTGEDSSREVGLCEFQDKSAGDVGELVREKRGRGRLYFEYAVDLMADYPRGMKFCEPS